jgi:nitroreductase
MEIMEAIFTRKSIREYTSQVVPDELVQDLLAAAMQAPSAGNQQAWHFVVVTDRTHLNALASVLPYAQMLKTSPLGIAVCADLENAKYPEFWAQDCSAATQNLLLSAHARGLGAVWTAVYPVEDRVAGVKQILGLPDPVMPLCIVPVGYPAEKPEPTLRRYDESRLHHNHW